MANTAPKLQLPTQTRRDPRAAIEHTSFKHTLIAWWEAAELRRCQQAWRIVAAKLSGAAAIVDPLPDSLTSAMADECETLSEVAILRADMEAQS